jgi:hypothetical protein
MAAKQISVVIRDRWLHDVLEKASGMRLMKCGIVPKKASPLPSPFKRFSHLNDAAFPRATHTSTPTGSGTLGKHCFDSSTFNVLPLFAFSRGLLNHLNCPSIVVDKHYVVKQSSHLSHVNKYA